MEPGKMIRHDWHYENEPETVVEWMVEAANGGTVVTLTHTGFLAENDTQAYRQGWMAFLYRLKAMAECTPMIVRS
jgi:hypothetical protein